MYNCVTWLFRKCSSNCSSTNPTDDHRTSAIYCSAPETRTPTGDIHHQINCSGRIRNEKPHTHTYTQTNHILGAHGRLSTCGRRGALNTPAWPARQMSGGALSRLASIVRWPCGRAVVPAWRQTSNVRESLAVVAEVTVTVVQPLRNVRTCVCAFVWVFVCVCVLSFMLNVRVLAVKRTACTRVTCIRSLVRVLLRAIPAQWTSAAARMAIHHPGRDVSLGLAQGVAHLPSAPKTCSDAVEFMSMLFIRRSRLGMSKTTLFYNK